MVAATFSAGGEGGACRLPTAAVFGRPCHARETGAKPEMNRGGCPVHGSDVSSLIYKVEI